MSRVPQLLRRSTWPLSWFYGCAVRLRNAMFDRGLRSVHRLSVPVVSVGNLSVGGTGKTPTVLWLAAAARRAGRTPGVLARGYGRAGDAELNDEGAMLAARLPGLLQVQDPDRVRGGRELERLGADLIILDDGFQHRRLHRDSDLLCMDARAPFADERLLPAGDLREAPAALRRADAVILTRAQALASDAIAACTRRVQQLAGRALPVFAAAFLPRDLLAMPAGEVLPLAHLHGLRVGLLSAIARPQTFVESVTALGAEVVWSECRRDHHHYTGADAHAVVARAAADEVVVVVTEKDDVKLQHLDLPRWVLRMEMSFLGATPSAELLGLR